MSSSPESAPLSPQASSTTSTLTETDMEFEARLLNDSLNSSTLSLPTHTNTNTNQMALDTSLNLSQISGWSTFTPGWNDSFHLVLSEAGSEAEESEDDQQNLKDSVHDIFVERCCTLYNDIQNAIDEIEFEDQLPCLDHLSERLAKLMNQAAVLADSAPDLGDFVKLRMQTINRAMEQLKLRQSPEHRNKDAVSPMHQLRKWLQFIETQLEEFRDEIGRIMSSAGGLQRLRSDHQCLQLQIESEGQSLLAAAKKHLQTRNFSNLTAKKSERIQRNLQQLEQRLFATWLRSLENIERIEALLNQIEGPSCAGPEPVSSDDDEPVQKRRRTLSATNTTPTSSRTSTPTHSPEAPPSVCSPRSTTSDGHLIPSSTESECDPDTIPFLPGEYESFAPAQTLHAHAHTTEVGAATEGRESMACLVPDPPNSPWATPSVSGSCEGGSRQQLQDVGYSSGENSVHEALNSLCSSDSSSVSLLSSPRKSFYQTVPLDEAGGTDTEFFPQLPSEEGVIGSRHEMYQTRTEEPLSESMIVQPDTSLTNAGAAAAALPNDFQEVMELLEENDDNDSVFDAQLEALRHGTQWRELKPRTRSSRISTPRKSISASRSEMPSTGGKGTDASREASSEESDGERVAPDPAALPPVPPSGTKKHRRIKKAFRGRDSMDLSEAPMKNSLTNVAMDESVYIFNDPAPDKLMSQSLTNSFTLPNTRRSLGSKRKLERHRMHRSVSDHVDLSWNIQALSNSFHAQLQGHHGAHLSNNELLMMELGEPLMSSTLRRPAGSSHSVRRPSVESLGSTTSSGTVLDSGDANYEWDEYRDPSSILPDMTAIAAITPHTSGGSLLEDSLIEEDFHALLPVADPSGLEEVIEESRQKYYQVRRIFNDHDPLAKGNEQVRQALRVSARDNVKKLTAIVKAMPRTVDMQQVNEVELLQKQWKATLSDLANGEPDADPQEEEQKTVKSLQQNLAQLKGALKDLLATDSSRLRLADVEAFISSRKLIWDKIHHHRTELQRVADLHDDKFRNAELCFMLRHIDDALKVVSVSTAQLEQSLQRYNSMGSLQESLADLEAKLNSSTPHAEIVQHINGELELCQERMDALETVCNRLACQLGDLAALNGQRKPGKEADFWKEMRQLKDELARVKAKFETFQQTMPPVAANHSPKKELRKRKTRESATNTATPTHTATATNTGSAGVEAKKRAAPAPVSVAGRVVRAFRDSRLLQLLLGLTTLVFLGLVLVSFYHDDTPQNNWRRMFGPQLDYINGPPPS